MNKLYFLLFFVIVCFYNHSNPYDLHAHSVPEEKIFHMPDIIKNKIRMKIKNADNGFDSTNNCDGKILLFSDNFFDLNNKNLLILLGISDYLCSDSNTFLPITVDFDGNWKQGTFKSGKPTLLTRGNDNVIWMNSQWYIEGTYPTLYRSDGGGLNWKEVSLPGKIDETCGFEWLTQICFYENRIRLKFHSDCSDKTEYREGDIANIITKKPVWNEVSKIKSEYLGKKCSFYSISEGKWIRYESESGSSIIFKTKYNQYIIKVIIPNAISEN